MMLRNMKAGWKNLVLVDQLAFCRQTTSFVELLQNFIGIPYENI